MKTYPNCAFGRNRHRFAKTPLELFDRRASPVVPAQPAENLAIRSIARRFGVPVHLARVIAENAGIGGRA